MADADYLLEWANLLLRWLHLVTGIAWIGASFYFVWLDDSLKPPADPALRARGVAGELWAVHGGGFYNPQKYLVAPPALPAGLHWFKWEAYSTWLSGFALLGVLYLARPGVYLVDPAVAPLAPWCAALLAPLLLAGGWLAYDRLCRSRLAQRGSRLGLAVSGLVLALAALFGNLYAPRAAWLLTGAALGTIMVANVYFVIMPGQRALVAALRRGETPDPAPGRRAKQRSVHNTYLTLPVLFAMTGNHAAFLYGRPQSWWVLLVAMAAGALIRRYFVQRHQQAADWRLAAAGVGLLALLAVLLVPTRPAAEARAALDPGRVRAVIASRCAVCHAATPTQPGFTAPPQGVRLDADAQIRLNAPRIHAQAVASRAMPPGNLTGMTEAERALLGAWIAAGAPL